MTTVLFRKLNEFAICPQKATSSAAGFDVVAANQDPICLAPGKRGLIPTGIAIELPEGFEAQIRPRSGLALKNGVTVLNTPGTIDADYRGEIGIILINHGEQDFVVERGMRVAQMVISSVVEAVFKEADSLAQSERNAGGFGSTGISA